MLHKYPGNKNREHVYKTIINNIPKVDYFIELFAGSGAIASELIKINTQPFIVYLNDINKKIIDELVNKFKRDVFYSNLDVFEFIELYASEKTDNQKLYFLDPPYLHDTRNFNSMNLYDFEMTDKDHVKLLEAVLQIEDYVMIIHPKYDLYDTMLKDWRKIEIKIRYHQKTSIEYLYMNYPENLPLQTYEYLGKDCWDRQRIKRKSESIVNKFKKMPVLERNLILEKLNNEYILK